jgi:hypothetical protein
MAKYHFGKDMLVASLFPSGSGSGGTSLNPGLHARRVREERVLTGAIPEV